METKEEKSKTERLIWGKYNSSDLILPGGEKIPSKSKYILKIFAEAYDPKTRQFGVRPSEQIEMKAREVNANVVARHKGHYYFFYVNPDILERVSEKTTTCELKQTPRKSTTKKKKYSLQLKWGTLNFDKTNSEENHRVVRLRDGCNLPLDELVQTESISQYTFENQKRRLLRPDEIEAKAIRLYGKSVIVVPSTKKGYPNARINFYQPKKTE